MFFQNIKLKLNSKVWMTLKSSVVNFQALQPLQPQWPQWPQQPHWPQWPRKLHFFKNFTDPRDLIIPSTKITNTSPFLWNGSSKIHFFTDIWDPFCQQISRPPEPTRHQNSIKWWILLPFRPDLYVTLHYEIPCRFWMYLIFLKCV